MTDVHIEVMHTYDRHGAKDVAHHFDCDSGPLALPAHIKLGASGEVHKPIQRYADQVDEYAIWLEDSIKAGDISVMSALEEIYTKAQGAGIILTTRCCPDPWVTHAHAIKRQIMTLAGLS